MKKNVIVGLIVAVIVGLLLFVSFRGSNKTQDLSSMGTSADLKDTLAAEGIKIADSNYKETDDQVVIYMFRGQGCSHCLEFLEYINSIVKEYGSKFKMRSYEVWNNSDNGSLQVKVAEKLGAEVEQGSVPFVIIGDTTIIGFQEADKKTITDTINKMYKQEVSERFDVMKLEEKPAKKNDALWIIIPILVFLVYVFLTKTDSPEVKEEPVKKEATVKEVKKEVKAEPKKKTTTSKSKTTKKPAKKSNNKKSSKSKK